LGFCQLDVGELELTRLLRQLAIEALHALLVAFIFFRQESQEGGNQKEKGDP
jgi:hypothetical protein